MCDFVVTKPNVRACVRRKTKGVFGPVSGDGALNEARVSHGKRFEIQTKTLHCSRKEIVNNLRSQVSLTDQEIRG